MKIKILFILLAAMLLATSRTWGTEENLLPDNESEATAKPKLRGKVKIGVILPRGRFFSDYARSVQKGINLAVREVNDTGGVSGRRLVMLYKKVRGTEDTLWMFNKFAGHVPAVIGPLLDEDAIAVAGIAEEKQTVAISPTATSPLLSGSSPYFFRTVGSDFSQGQILSNVIKDVLLPQEAVQEIAVLYVDDIYGTGLKDEFLKNYPAGKVAGQLSFAEGDEDFNAQLAEIKALGVKLVVLISYETEGGLILKQAAGTGLGLTWICSDGLKTDAILEQANTFGTNRVLATSPMEMVPDDATDTFISLYLARYPRGIIDPYAAYGYDTVKVIVEAMLQGDETADGIRKALGNVRLCGVTGMKVFDSGGDCPSGYDVWEIKNSEWEVIARLMP